MTLYKRNRHSCYSLKYHLVVVTKYRHKCITKEMLIRMKELISEQLERWGAELIEMNGEEDHIHLLFEAPPQVELAKLINSMKSVTSRIIRKEFSGHLKNHYWKPVFWSPSYLVLSVGGATIDVIKSYIQEQNAPE